MKKILLVLACLIVIACADIEQEEAGESRIEENEEIKQDNKTDALTFGSTFEFWDFEVEIGSEEDVIFRTVENQYSDDYGADVLGIPVKITNVGEESGRLSSWVYTFFGPDETQTKNMESWFDDYDIWSHISL